MNVQRPFSRVIARPAPLSSSTLRVKSDDTDIEALLQSVLLLPTSDDDLMYMEPLPPGDGAAKALGFLPPRGGGGGGGGKGAPQLPMPKRGSQPAAAPPQRPVMQLSSWGTPVTMMLAEETAPFDDEGFNFGDLSSSSMSSSFDSTSSSSSSESWLRELIPDTPAAGLGGGGGNAEDCIMTTEWADGPTAVPKKEVKNDTKNKVAKKNNKNRKPLSLSLSYVPKNPVILKRPVGAPVPAVGSIPKPKAFTAHQTRCRATTQLSDTLRPMLHDSEMAAAPAAPSIGSGGASSGSSMDVVSFGPPPQVESPRRDASAKSAGQKAFFANESAVAAVPDWGSPPSSGKSLAASRDPWELSSRSYYSPPPPPPPPPPSSPSSVPNNKKPYRKTYGRSQVDQHQKSTMMVAEATEDFSAGDKNKKSLEMSVAMSISEILQDLDESHLRMLLSPQSQYSSKSASGGGGTEYHEGYLCHPVEDDEESECLAEHLPPATIWVLSDLFDDVDDGSHLTDQQTVDHREKELEDFLLCCGGVDGAACGGMKVTNIDDAVVVDKRKPSSSSDDTFSFVGTDYSPSTVKSALYK